MSFPFQHTLSGSLAAGGAADEETLQLPGDGKFREWRIVSFHFIRSAGTAANMTVRVGQATGFTNGDIDTRLAYASQAVGTAISEVFPQPIPIQADADGRIYLQPGWDAGADNTAGYSIVLERCTGNA